MCQAQPSHQMIRWRIIWHETQTVWVSRTVRNSEDRLHRDCRGLLMNTVFSFKSTKFTVGSESSDPVNEIFIARNGYVPQDRSGQ